MPDLCRHCHRPGAKAARGLCWKCYRTPGVKPLYAASKVTKPPGSRLWNQAFEDDPPCADDPTPEQVAEFEAWWEVEQRRLESLPALPRVCRVEAG